MSPPTNEVIFRENPTLVEIIKKVRRFWRSSEFGYSSTDKINGKPKQLIWIYKNDKHASNDS